MLFSQFSQAKGAPGKRKALEDDSPLEGQQDLLVRDEYEQDSSDEEVGILEFSWNFGILSRIGDGSDEFGKK